MGYPQMRPSTNSTALLVTSTPLHRSSRLCTSFSISLSQPLTSTASRLPPFPAPPCREFLASMSATHPILTSTSHLRSILLTLHGTRRPIHALSAPLLSPKQPARLMLLSLSPVATARSAPSPISVNANFRFSSVERCAFINACTTGVSMAVPLRSTYVRCRVLVVRKKCPRCEDTERKFVREVRVSEHRYGEWEAW